MLGAWGPRKRRTREHVIADLGVNLVERQALLCGFTAERVIHDYGYDLLMLTFDEGEVEPGQVLFQVKATDQVRLVRRKQAVAFGIEFRDLRLWLAEDQPVILIIYDAQADRAYWLDLQAYFEPGGPGQSLRLHGTTTVYLPLANGLDQEAMREIRKIKNQRQPRSKKARERES